MENEVPIHTLRPGQGFDLLLETTGRKIRGTLVRLGAGSATIRTAKEPKIAMVTDRETGAKKEITIPPSKAVEHWSLATLVIPLDTFELGEEESEITTEDVEEGGDL